MTFKGVLSTNSNSSNWNQVNGLAKQVQAREVTQVFKDDIDSTRRVLLGKGADGFYGLKVSPPGVDVYTAADSELVFNSNQNVLKIVATGTISMPNATGAIPGTPSVAYASANTGIISTTPLMVIGLDTGGSFSNSLPIAFFDDSGLLTQTVNIYTTIVSSDNVYVNVQVKAYYPTSATSGTIKYYVLQETAV